MKRLFAAALTLALLLCTAPFPAGAGGLKQDADGYYLIDSYEEFYDHLISVQGFRDEVYRYRLNRDIDQKDAQTDHYLLFNAVDAELDLNGHTLRREANADDSSLVMAINGAKLHIFDSSPSGQGTLIYSPNRVARPCVVTGVNSELLISSGSYVMDPVQATVPYVLRIEGGRAVVTGGLFDGTRGHSDYHGFTVDIIRVAASDTAPRVYIYGGRFIDDGGSITVYEEGTFDDILHPECAVYGGEFINDSESGFADVLNGVGHVLVFGGLMRNKCVNPQYSRTFAEGTTIKKETVDGLEYNLVTPPHYLLSGQHTIQDRIEYELESYVFAHQYVEKKSEYYLQFAEYRSKYVYSPATCQVGARDLSPVELTVPLYRDDVKCVNLYVSEKEDIQYDFAYSPRTLAETLEDPGSRVNFTVERPMEETSRLYLIKVIYDDDSESFSYLRVDYAAPVFTLSGTPYPSMNPAVYGKKVYCAVNGLPEGLPEDTLRFVWSVGNTPVGTQRTLMLDDPAWIGRELTVRVTSTVADGALLSDPVTVGKAFNNDPPVRCRVKVRMNGETFDGVDLSYLQTDQEYLLTAKDPAAVTDGDWDRAMTFRNPEAGFSAAYMKSTLGLDLKTGDTLQVLSRFKETDTARAGSQIQTVSTRLQNNVRLEAITFPDAVNGRVFIPLDGAEHQIRYELQPANANSGGKIILRGSGAFTLVSPTDAVPVYEASGLITVRPQHTGGAELTAYYLTNTENRYGSVEVIVYDPEHITPGFLRPVAPLEDVTVYAGTGYAPQVPDFTLQPTVEPTYRWYFTRSTQQGYEKFTSCDAAVIDPVTGEVSALAPGRVTVSLYADDFRADDYLLTVTEKPDNYVTIEELFPDPDEMRLTVGERRRIDLLKSPANATSDNFLFASSDPKVARVDGEGAVTGKGAGTARITVTALDDGVSAVVAVTVAGFGGAVKGDVDGDGNVTSTDARLVLQLSVGKIRESDLAVSAAADADGDGNITSTDARLILQFSVGKIGEWP